MATLSQTENMTPLEAIDVFERPSWREGLLVLLPAILAAVLGAWLSYSGVIGGAEGLWGGEDGPLEGVDGVLGGLLVGGISLLIGFFISLFVVARTTRGKRQRYWRQTLTAYLYLSPSVGVVLVFTVLSMVYAVYVSLHKFGLGQLSGRREPIFLGLDNYTQALFETGTRQTEFWQSLMTTFWFTLGSIPFQIVLALVVAVLLFRKMRGVEFYRIAFFLPYVTATIALAEVWVVLFSRAEIGVVNNLLESFGVARQGWLLESRGIVEILAAGMGVELTAPAWLPDWAHSLVLGPSQALVVIMGYSVWKYFGFSLIILLAGLSNIDRELYEAAEIDGANARQSFRQITIPLLSPSLYYVALISMIGSLRSFDTIFQLSIRASAGSGPGGPLGTTQTLVIYIFNQFWRDSFYGYGSALALILFVVILGITLFQQRVMGRRVFYG
jgi:multiple sugar transport system permease protein